MSSTGTVGGISVQHLYELCYCLWLLSYDCDSNPHIRHHFHRDGAVAALVDLVASAPREKVVRLALSSLRNLALCGGDPTRFVPNLTGTKAAYRPPGHILKGGQRDKATGDYEAWTPE